MIGPALGGSLVKHLSWRWVFYVNLPFGVAAAIIVIAALHEQIEQRRHKLDVLGALLLTLGLTALLLATSKSARGATLAGPVAAALLVAFILVERHAAEPVIPLPLFARRVMSISSLCGAIIGGAMMATTTFVPLFVQGVLHGDPTQAGTAFTPMLVCWPVASTLSGRLIPRIGFRPLIRLGLGITAVAGLCLALYGERFGMRGLQLITGLFGAGMGFANTALLISVQTAVSWEQRGIATASTMFFRTIGGALSVSAMGGVLITTLTRDGAVSPEAASRLLSPEGARGLERAVFERITGALALGIDRIFWIISLTALAAFAMSLLFPHVPTQAKTEAGASVPAGH
jgi:MFS family permease